MSAIHIYRIPQVVDLTLGSGGVLMNYPVNRTDFRLFRHVDNEIEFWIKNIDRKAVAIPDGSVTLHITDYKTQRVLLTRDLIILDEDKGLARLFISGEEAAALSPGTHHYSVIYTRSDGVQMILYTDRDRRGTGYVEVTEGPLPDPLEATPISMDEFVIRDSKYYSGAYMGAASVMNYSGQHSLAISFSDFTGSFTVQGSLQAQPSSTDTQWFEVKKETYVDETGLVHFPFEGNLLWVRFVVVKVDGDIELIQYRN